MGSSYLLERIMRVIEVDQNTVDKICEAFEDQGCDTIYQVEHPQVQNWYDRQFPPQEDWV